MAGRVVAVILAAGASRRMGTPKLALPLGGQPLLAYAIEAARESRVNDVVVVTGSHADALTSLLTAPGLARVHNAAWAEGLSSSLRCGVAAAEERGADAVLILLGDQPDVTPALLNSLIEAHESGAHIAACRYADGTTGPPALFDREEFENLRRLTGDQGARSLLDRAPDRAEFVAFPRGADDVDRPEDLERADDRFSR